MPDSIVSGAGDGQFKLRITSDNRASTDGIFESITSQASRDGDLWGMGTGFIATTWTDDFYPVLWLRNDDPDKFIHIEQLIWGWNGGTSSRNVMARSFIKYQTSVPTGANADAAPAIENISKSGTASAVTDTKATGHKWDGTGVVGMTGSTGGFLQIPNMIPPGFYDKRVNGEIILGQNDTMEMQVQPEESGIYVVSIIYRKAPIKGRI